MPYQPKHSELSGRLNSPAATTLHLAVRGHFRKGISKLEIGILATNIIAIA